MTTLTVGAKGQVTLEADLLDHLRIKPGDKINVVPLPDGKLQVSGDNQAETTQPAQQGEKRGLERFFRSIENKSGVHLTIDEIQEEIEKSWAGES
jgi:bifunctional DNA-binding transcriptional regulator/antitoxin component of YhaV-PrlF toxin-antitoxin module